MIAIACILLVVSVALLARYHWSIVREIREARAELEAMRRRNWRCGICGAGHDEDCDAGLHG